jgi:hypothetical protein
VANVFFIPKGDCLFRAWQFRDWIMKVHKITLEILDFESLEISTPEKLRDYFKDVKKNCNLILIAKNTFSSDVANSFARVIEEYYAQGFGLIVFNECLPSEFNRVVDVPSMHQHVDIMRLYPESIMVDYINNVAHLWELELSNIDVVQIAKGCGGFPWLVNEILRSIKNKSKDDITKLFNSDTFYWKIEQVIKSLPMSHQMAILSSDKIFESQVNNELIEFGFINQQGELIELLKKWVENYKKDNMIINNDVVMIAGKDLGMYFSDSEKNVLSMFVENMDVVLKREDVAKIFWGSRWEEYYSDWSLDQVISRLRKKLKEKNIPINIITKKGFGYACR